MLEVSEREEGVVVLHLLIGPLKTRSRLELVPIGKPSTLGLPTSRFNDDITTAPSGLMYHSYALNQSMHTFVIYTHTVCQH